MDDPPETQDTCSHLNEGIGWTVPGSVDPPRLKALEREVKELRQATKSCGWPVRFSRRRSSTASRRSEVVHRPAPWAFRG